MLRVRCFQPLNDEVATTVCIAGLLLALLAASNEQYTRSSGSARLNNIGVAYMNQQCSRKGLKSIRRSRRQRSESESDQRSIAASLC